jgi:anti-sigma factor RsiW
MSEECKAYFERVSEYLDGELNDEICRKIEAHLSECPECRDCIESLRKTIGLCREAAQEEIPQAARERVRRTLRDCFGRGSA